MAGVDPGRSAEVSRGTPTPLGGFARRPPLGRLDAIRSVSGVTAAFEREIQADDNVTPDVDNVTPAEGGFRGRAPGGPEPRQPERLVIMHADQVSQKGAGKVIAVIDTGVERPTCLKLNVRPGLLPWMWERWPPWPPSWVRASTGTYVSEKFPFAYDYATMTPTRPRRGSLRNARRWYRRG